MYESDSIWTRKGATLSDKSARQEFGLTQQEVFAANLPTGQLHNRDCGHRARRTEMEGKGKS